LKVLEEEPQSFWGRAFAWIFGLGGLGVLLLALLGQSWMAAGFAEGIATLTGLLYYYRRLALRFARPDVPSDAFRRVLMLSALLKYPALLLIVYLVSQQGVSALFGFLLGVGFPLLVFTGFALQNWRVPKKEG